MTDVNWMALLLFFLRRLEYWMAIGDVLHDGDEVETPTCREPHRYIYSLSRNKSWLYFYIGISMGTHFEQGFLSDIFRVIKKRAWNSKYQCICGSICDAAVTFLAQNDYYEGGSSAEALAIEDDRRNTNRYGRFFSSKCVRTLIFSRPLKRWKCQVLTLWTLGAVSEHKMSLT